MCHSGAARNAVSGMQFNRRQKNGILQRLAHAVGGDPAEVASQDTQMRRPQATDLVPREIFNAKASSD
jgi:hypothetical protein